MIPDNERPVIRFRPTDVPLLAEVEPYDEEQAAIQRAASASAMERRMGFRPFGGEW